MRGKFLIIAFAAAAFHVSAAVGFLKDGNPMPPCAADGKSAVITTVGELSRRLAALEPYRSAARYGVLLPSAENEIVYDINLQSAAASDSLAPCDYFIEWSVGTPSGESTGFSSYSGGNHFRYADERLQEYHFGWDSIPFQQGRGSVQLNARFAELLPAFLAEQMAKIATDSAYACKLAPAVYNGREAVRVDATEHVRGYVARQLSYLFDAVTGAPLRITMENNPGAISEQSVSVEYLPADGGTAMASFNEAALIERYPEVFERFRDGNFRLENLPGTAMPQFALPTVTGERYTHHRGDRFLHPTVIAIIDPAVASVASTVADVREAVNAMPMTADIIWVFKSRNIDTIEEIVGCGLLQGETVLMGANAIARDCGVTAYPAFIFVAPDGIIKSVHIGANKDLRSIVMQKVALM